VLVERIPAVPRLRQCLVRTPFGCGPPVWVGGGRRVGSRRRPHGGAAGAAPRAGRRSRWPGDPDPAGRRRRNRTPAVIPAPGTRVAELAADAVRSRWRSLGQLCAVPREARRSMAAAGECALHGPRRARCSDRPGGGGASRRPAPTSTPCTGSPTVTAPPSTTFCWSRPPAPSVVTRPSAGLLDRRTVGEGPPSRDGQGRRRPAEPQYELGGQRPAHTLRAASSGRADLQRLAERAARHARTVAVSSTALNASPARSCDSVSSEAVPSAVRTAPSSRSAENGPRSPAAKLRAAGMPAVPRCGRFAAGTPSSPVRRPLQDRSSDA